MDAHGEREQRILDMPRAGGLSQGTGLCSTVRITHSIGEPEPSVILTVVDHHNNKLTIPIPAGYAGVVRTIAESLLYHEAQAIQEQEKLLQRLRTRR